MNRSVTAMELSNLCLLYRYSSSTFFLREQTLFAPDSLPKQDRCCPCHECWSVSGSTCVWAFLGRSRYRRWSVLYFQIQQAYALTKIEIDNPEALSKYYRLLLSIARVITSVVLSRGPQNDQTIEDAKGFLMENRPLVVSMFKRQARIGGVSFDDAGVDIDELVELFVLLIAVTDFLDVSSLPQILLVLRG